MALAYHTLHVSDLVTIVDVRCRPCGPGSCGTEVAAAHEVVLPRRGSFVRRSNAGEQHGDPNTLMFFAPDDEYEVHHPVPGGDDCTALAFSASAAMEATDGGPWPRDQVAAANAFVSNVHRLRLHLHASHPDPLAVEEAALALLGAAIRAAAAQRSGGRARRSQTARHRSELVASVRQVLAARLSDPLTLAEIAAAVHSSPFHLARVFRGHTGSSIHRYRTQLRLREALERIVGGERDLSRLALEVGFASHSHFTDSFRAAFGTAPSRYRQPDGARRIRELARQLGGE